MAQQSPIPPTFADPVLIDPQTRKAAFNPIWLRWFLDLAALLQATAVAIASAVIGPSSSTDGHVAIFSGGTGKLIKDTGLTLSGTNTGDQLTIDSAYAAGGSITIATGMGHIQPSILSLSFTDVLTINGTGTYIIIGAG